MRALPFLLLLFCIFPSLAQDTQWIDLKWKVSDTLTYKTEMNDIMLEADEDEQVSDSISGVMKDMFKSIQEEMSRLKYVTKLFPDEKGNIDIAMLMQKEEADTTGSIFTSMAKMNDGVVLRGKVSPEGELLSFYYKSAQSNLIAVLFELPTHKIKIGDQWSASTSLISMDQNFRADTIYRHNTVRLADVVSEGNDKIAIVEYDIKEYVSGDFGSGMFNALATDPDNKIYMEISHKATGYFNIGKGRWDNYEGIMEVSTNFSLFGMGGKKTNFILIPEE